MFYLSGLVAEVTLLTPRASGRQSKKISNVFGVFAHSSPESFVGVYWAPHPLLMDSSENYRLQVCFPTDPLPCWSLCHCIHFFLSSPTFPGLNQGDTSLGSHVRRFRGKFLRERLPPGGDLIRPLWPLQMFAILLFFSFRDGSVLEFQAGLFKTHFSVGVVGGGGVTDWSQMGDITQAPLGSG